MYVECEMTVLMDVTIKFMMTYHESQYTFDFRTLRLRHVGTQTSRSIGSTMIIK